MVEDVQVVIVGAGPVGLAIGIGLAQTGVSFVILDALAERQRTSRAAVIHARTLEALEPLGVTYRLVAQGIQVTDFRIRDRDRTLLAADFQSLDSPYPFLLMIPQDETEAILTERLRELGHEVVRPAQVTSLERQTDGRVRVGWTNPVGPGTVTCRHVVGADGQHSVVREGAGLGFPGATYGSFLLVDVRMDWPLGREVTLFASGEGVLVVAPMSSGRHRVVAQLADAPAEPAFSDVQALLDARGPGDRVQVRELLWGSRFRVNHRLATSFRAGPFVLAGDAAHVHSPAGGQGMNLGLRDAVALADALASSRSHSGEAALDRYADSQRQAARGVLRMTERLTCVATLQGRSARTLRNVVLGGLGRVPAVQRRLARSLAGYG